MPRQPERLRFFFDVPIPEHRFVSLAKAATYADCNERTLRRHIAEGNLTGYRLGRAIRIDLNELEAWMTPIPTAKAG